MASNGLGLDMWFVPFDNITFILKVSWWARQLHLYYGLQVKDIFYRRVTISQHSASGQNLYPLFLSSGVSEEEFSGHGSHCHGMHHALWSSLCLHIHIPVPATIWCMDKMGWDISRPMQ